MIPATAARRTTLKARTVLLTSLALVLVASAVTLGLQRGATAQTPPPTQGPPPAHDYDPTTSGVQGPTSPLLAAPDGRYFRGHQLAIGLLVPLAELQALLPDGFEALPSAAGADTSLVGLTFVYQQRSVHADGSLLGPISELLVGATVQNTLLGRQESLFLTAVVNDRAVVAAFNEQFGPGSHRYGDVAVLIEEAAGSLRFTFDVADPALGSHLRVAASGPAGLSNRLRFDPQPLPFRFLNGDGRAGPASRAASQSDGQTVPTAMANVQVTANDGTLRLPSGSLTIGGVGPNVGMGRWLEVIAKLE
jgi:hypothetical protein